MFLGGKKRASWHEMGWPTKITTAISTKDDLKFIYFRKITRHHLELSLKSRGVFRTQSNIYGEVFFRKNS